MRIQLGSPPKSAMGTEEPDAGKPIRQPGRWTSVWIAPLSGVILLFISFVLYAGLNWIIPEGESSASYSSRTIPWAGMIVIFFLCVLAHELLHILLHPGSGRPDSSMLFIDWKKLQFGVYYEGRIPRDRWIAMRLLPVVGLTILPLAGLLILDPWMTFALESYLWVLILTNSLGSGGDLAAVLIVLRQVPAAGALNFKRGKAYWLPADVGEGKKPGWEGE